MPSLREGELSIGKLAKEEGISTATINFYVKEGILPPPRKLNRTRAAYSQRHRRLLHMVKRMQTAGYSLGHIRKAFDHFGTDEAGLSKLEGIGYLKPLPPVRNDPRRRPIEQFEPVGRAAFIALAGVPEALVDRLETWGALRPQGHDRYDARDLWLVRTVQSLVDEGIALERLAFLEGLLASTRDASWILMDLAERHLPELRRRDVRFTDLIAPFLDMFGYLLGRVHDEQHPNWREKLCEDDGPRP